MLAAGKAASMPPLLPLTNLFAAPIFRVSFLALIVTHIVTFFVCYSIGQSDVAAVLALTICTLVVPAVSALQAYIRGELAAWWSYKEV
jgi:hypothetical protein